MCHIYRWVISCVWEGSTSNGMWWLYDLLYHVKCVYILKSVYEKNKYIGCVAQKYWLWIGRRAKWYTSTNYCTPVQWGVYAILICTSLSHSWCRVYRADWLSLSLCVIWWVFVCYLSRSTEKHILIQNERVGRRQNKSTHLKCALMLCLPETCIHGRVRPSYGQTAIRQTAIATVAV